MNLDLKCPYCGFKINVFLPDDATEAELTIAKACPCGRDMETAQEIQARMDRTGIKKRTFYTLIGKPREKDGKLYPVAVKTEGIEFKRCGITLYAYQKEMSSGIQICYIIDPETGLSLQSGDYTLDTAPKHISRNAIKGLKEHRANGGSIYYQKSKIRFQRAERMDKYILEE